MTNPLLVPSPAEFRRGERFGWEGWPWMMMVDDDDDVHKKGQP
jgi:hypothetical protein